MKFTDKELENLYRALKILENGEGLLGIDIDESVVKVLIQKLEKYLSKKIKSKVNKEVEELIHEAEMALKEYTGGPSEYDSDREFGPSYPTGETMNVLNRAINDGLSVDNRVLFSESGEVHKT